MSLKSKLFKNSSVYSIANVLQQMLAFFLLPLYTRFLTPTDYGIITVINSISAFLVILLNLSLYAAISRFYFDYKDDEKKLSQFWGTIFTFLFFFIGITTSALFVFGEYILQPVLDNVSFYPYMMIGLVTIAFEPFFRSLTGILIATEKSKLYGVIFIVRFLITTISIIVLITGFDSGAKGVLISHAGVSVLFFIVGIIILRKKVTWFYFKFSFLIDALKYSLPLIPHHLSAIIKGTTDKLFLNNMISTASAGLYNIAFRFSSLIGVLHTSVNFAFYPIFMKAMKDDNSDDLQEIRRIGLFLVFGYFFIAMLMSFFSKEVIILFTTKEYYSSSKLIPVLAFSSAVVGVYVLIVNTLFYFKEKLKFISIVTITSALLNIGLNYFMIIEFDSIGAAYASLWTNIFTVILIGLYQRRFTKVKWEYGKYTLIFLICFCISICINLDYVQTKIDHLLLFLFMKSMVAFVIFLLLNKVCWGNWFYLIRYGRRILVKMIEKKSD